MTCKVSVQLKYCWLLSHFRFWYRRVVAVLQERPLCIDRTIGILSDCCNFDTLTVNSTRQ